MRRVIRKRIRREGPGTQVEADVNAVIAANVNEPGTRTRVSSRQRIVQRKGTQRKAREGGDERG